jgi:hypothetical protein
MCRYEKAPTHELVRGLYVRGCVSVGARATISGIARIGKLSLQLVGTLNVPQA